MEHDAQGIRDGVKASGEEEMKAITDGEAVREGCVVAQYGVSREGIIKKFYEGHMRLPTIEIAKRVARCHARWLRRNGYYEVICRKQPRVAPVKGCYPSYFVGAVKPDAPHVAIAMQAERLKENRDKLVKRSVEKEKKQLRKLEFDLMRQMEHAEALAQKAMRECKSPEHQLKLLGKARHQLRRCRQLLKKGQDNGE
jgi:hypothetical protein